MNNFFKIVLSMSVSGSILSLILFAVRPLIKRHFSKAWQYYIWLVVIFRLLIPYSPEASLVGNLFDMAETVGVEHAIYLVPAIPDMEVRGNTLEQLPDYNPDEHAIPQHGKGRTFEYLEYIWAFGVLLLFALRIFQYGSFICKVKAGSSIVKTAKVLDIFHQVENELRIKRKVSLCQSNLIKSPMLIGLLKPVIIIPENPLALGKLNYVFRHELIHFKHLDIWYKWLVQLTVCIHWFNPLVYIMSRQINNLCEFACDEAVSKELDAEGKMEYGNTIINVVSFDTAYKCKVFSMTLCEGKKNLKERLGAIMKAEKKSGRIILLSLVLIVVLCCTAVLLGTYSAGDYGKRPLNESDMQLEYTAASKQDTVDRSIEALGQKHLEQEKIREKVVLIDPGHGGDDTGAVYVDENSVEIREKDLNLEISLLLRDMLKESGINAGITRHEDLKVTLEDRMDSAMNLNACLFVSVHFGANMDRTERGTLTLHNSSNNDAAFGITGKKAAQLIHNKVVRELGTEDAGMMEMESLKYSSLNMPAVVIDLAFMTNASDRERLMTEEFSLDAAKALQDGIIAALNEM
ncbi:MAG: N-acetylmuramoyl-L-alanine amidase [Clostridia bacterium]|jgi:beta-lactamase regulating signal transducer with metallopeptidase domain|nr:N-acetylmuramoyl-L-alanine amidase [Clostridia bacterium]HOH89005.1 M56 family metallopeptidase [Bacillota bacterium]